MSPSTVIQKSTPITLTTGLFIAIIACVFWLGGEFKGMKEIQTAINVKVDGVADAQVADRKESHDWRTRTADILSELMLMTRDNKIRLDLEVGAK